MATITFALGALTKSFTVSAADLTRVTNALKANYGKVSDGAGGLRDMTNQEIFDKWASSNMQALKDVVKRVEGDTAAESARTAVSDIVAT